MLYNVYNLIEQALEGSIKLGAVPGKVDLVINESFMKDGDSVISNKIRKALPEIDIIRNVINSGEMEVPFDTEL